MKQPVFLTLALLLLAAVTITAGEPAQPPKSAQKKQRPMPKAEWLDPDRGAPNGTQYQTFPRRVPGREVSYLVWLPPGYDGKLGTSAFEFHRKSLAGLAKTK